MLVPGKNKLGSDAVSGEAFWQRREWIGFNDGQQGGAIKRTVAR